jgi:HAD superfamily hydrolase (TIGR01549 family)
MIKAVLFDMDGVLVNSFEAWLRLVNATAKEFGCPDISRKQFKSVYGQSTALDVALFFPNKTIAEIDNYYENHFYDFREFVYPAPESHATIEKLNDSGLKLAVITNTAGALARDIIKDLALGIECIIGGDEVENAKPSPDMIFEACRVLGVSSKESIVVGDSIYDMEAARASDSCSIGINGVLGDLTIKSLAELVGIVEN